MLWIALLSYPLLMVFAACMDLLTMRISNKISIALILAFLPLAVLSGLPSWSLTSDSILMHYACGLLILMITFGLFALGKIGGGDAKLTAASSVWVGWGAIVDYLAIVALIGGAFATLILLMRAFPMPAAFVRQTWIARLHQPKGRIPYGVALGVAAIIVFPETAIWLRTRGE